MALLERDLHLKALRSALGEADTEGRVALVYGEAGIGKTALVEHFLNEHKTKRRILQGACDSLFTPRPLGPLYDIAFQTQGSLFSLLDSESNRTAIFSACLNELQEQPTILVIEDVHWADEATLDLLKYLGRRIRQTTSLLILTYRDDEIGADHPLRMLLGDLSSSQALHRIPLSSLSRAAVYELSKNKQVDSFKLYRLTNGNPFFVTEVLAVDGGIPETVRDAVLARAARLSAAARRLLEAAAVIGSRVEAWLLSNIAGEEYAHVEECIARGMLQSQGEMYAFRHVLVRQTILESIAPQRKLTLHRMALNALKDAPETPNDFARLVNHAQNTKDVNAILVYAPAAARQASAASSHREAAALYELALRYADSLPPAEHAQLLEAYMVELDFNNRVAENIMVIQKAIDLWASVGNRLRQGANLAYLAGRLYLFGRNTEAEQTSKAAIAMLEALPPSIELARAYKEQCYIRMMHDDYAEAIRWGEKAVALAERFEDKETLAHVYNYMGGAMLVTDYVHGRALMEKSLAVARQANLTFSISGALSDLGLMLAEVYQLADAERYLREGIEYAMDHDDDHHVVGMLTSQVLIQVYQGHWAEALENVSEVLQSPYLESETHTLALFALGRLRLRRGDSEAQAILEEALELALKADSIPRMGKVQAARAEGVWLRGGNYQRVLEETRLIYDLAMSKGHPWITGELAFWRWRVGEEISAPAWIAGPFALQIAGDWRGAAKEWQNRNCPYEQAMALMDGDEAAQLEALEIFEHLGARPIIEKLKQKMRAQGTSVPRGPRPATRENPFGLTAREMEVLACLTQGLSNQAIAKRLSLSVRTVEHHTASILQKMGVQTRAEAVALSLKQHLLDTG
ncbi:MAG TPA: AAA family ATPase [Anaerolineales bacterium]|nr:AAA family ATPase [Anaerolineales bacterium]